MELLKTLRLNGVDALKRIKLENVKHSSVQQTVTKILIVSHYSSCSSARVVVEQEKWQKTIHISCLLYATKSVTLFWGYE